jgi:hypothetical protein
MQATVRKTQDSFCRRPWLIICLGRAWTVGELRNRDWNALHQLWWVCAKERNRLATEKIERDRLDAGYGNAEGKHRDETIQKTMKAILDTLAERQQAYTEAYELAKNDPNVDLSRTDGPQFTEPTYVRMICCGECGLLIRSRTNLNPKTSHCQTDHDRNLLDGTARKSLSSRANEL